MSYLKNDEMAAGWLSMELMYGTGKDTGNLAGYLSDMRFIVRPDVWKLLYDNREELLSDRFAKILPPPL